MLTSKQKELLLYIHKCVQETGVPPSFDEMKAALDLKSKSGIHRLITALEERGFVRRLPHRARALEIIKLPDALQSADVRSSASNSDNVVQLRGAASSRPELHKASIEPAHSSSVPVPLMGRIAAGVPISAIQDHTQDVSCPADMIGNGEHFALEVKGDSMIEAGIHEGDIVIIRRTPSANDGDIVVALVEDEEATLKRIRRRAGSVALEAANPMYETRVFGPDQVSVQGRLVGLMRRY